MQSHVSSQGSNTNICTLRNKMDALKKKLALWNSRLQEEDEEMFPLFDQSLIATDLSSRVSYST